ncbi:MAG: endonuclease/exonuclease/phosphatase family protein [Myxococcota bacterium]
MRLRILTLNVWGLPWPFGRHLGQRIEAIAATLPRLGADVLALQEVWTRRSRNALLEAGHAAGFRHDWHNDVALGGSGLLVLSRLPIADVRFQAYVVRGPPHSLGGDYYGGKGFAEVGLETAVGRIALVDTHLQALYDDRAELAPFQAAQVVQLAARLAEIDDPVVVAGDFNVDEGNREYRILRGLTGLRDVAAELDRRQPTARAANPYHRGRREPDQRIDYVFARDGAARRVRPVTLRRVYDESLQIEGRSLAYSDHAGVLAELEIVAAPGNRQRQPEPGAVELARRALAEGRAAAVERRRRQRLAAGAGVGGAVLAFSGTRRLTRRSWLRAGLHGSALLAVASAFGFAAFAEVLAPSEIRAFDTVSGWLDSLDA